MASTQGLQQQTSVASQVTEYESVQSEGSRPGSPSVNGQLENEDDMEKEILIKDLDTGQTYKLGFEGQKSGEYAQVTDLETGQAYQYTEFEEKLGLAAELKIPNILENISDDSRTHSQTSAQTNKRGAGRQGGMHSTSNSMVEAGYRAKVTVNRKLIAELTDVVLIQNIQAHQGHIWAIKFSVNNQYLATGGADCTVKLWNVVQTEDGSQLIKPEPYRIWQGHQREIMDLCWSKSQFLLSASMDKTVRLWHVKMDDQLRVFKHNDYVTSVNFHPKVDKIFISGSIDQKVRIWNIPETKVLDWSSVHEIITATQLSPDGRKVVVGTLKGKCFLYTCERERLEYNAKIEVKNSGQFSKGHKVTGIEYLPNSSNKILVTTNDSRIRMYDEIRFVEIQKFKGHSNSQTLIRSHFSRDGEFIISGSDDGNVYIWTTQNTYLPESAQSSHPKDKKEKLSSFETFQAHEGVVTVACFGPRLTAQNSSSQQLMEHTPSNSDNIPPMSKAVAMLLNGKDSFLGGQRYDNEQYKAIEQQLEKRIQAAPAQGMVIVTAGTNGELKVWENRGRPEWIQ
eukprot:TRINITY_DN4897_c0_g3_i1.p1 TRINITY_DN4897_c0_g3~~TRINITY_DN4897_c0_g3_i1.p1  ORF type:complete len:566 (-),score=49.54 TRINITY_DN4897_c0_g3_i1:1380-3077(-)